ncbi:hypothetical protein BJ166DRAFT_493114 [Pestalotiopsis sp. NC0098]|nr:hypothetical protein BJ166DRAFT_493114 [Pestalotiopsis sp. NC0098]
MTGTRVLAGAKERMPTTDELMEERTATDKLGRSGKGDNVNYHHAPVASQSRQRKLAKKSRDSHTYRRRPCYRTVETHELQSDGWWIRGNFLDDTTQGMLMACKKSSASVVMQFLPLSPFRDQEYRYSTAHASSHEPVGHIQWWYFLFRRQGMQLLGLIRGCDWDPERMYPVLLVSQADADPWSRLGEGTAGRAKLRVPQLRLLW